MDKKNEVKQLIEMINDNEEGYVFTNEDWVVKTVDAILDDHQIDTIHIYGKGDADTLKEDISLLGTEITIDVDNKFTSVRTSKIGLYVKTKDQYLDFEVTNMVSFKHLDKQIDIINDQKESDTVTFDDKNELLILRTDFIYTTDRGLDVKKVLDIYIPYDIAVVPLEEGAEY